MLDVTSTRSTRGRRGVAGNALAVNYTTRTGESFFFIVDQQFLSARGLKSHRNRVVPGR